MKEQTLQLLGLITDVNPYGDLPPGACSACDNVMLRKKGVHEPRIGFHAYSSTWATAAWDFERIFPGSSSVLTSSYQVAAPTQKSLVWDTGAAQTTVSLSVGGAAVAHTMPIGQSQLTRARGRCILTDTAQPIAIDSEGSASARLAGLSPIRWCLPSPGGSKGVAWKNTFGANFAAVTRRVQSDGYVLTSAPSPIVYAANTTGSDNSISVYFEWGTNANLAVGDYVDVYRTKFAAGGTDPGADLFLCGSYRLVVGDFSVGSAGFSTQEFPADDPGLGVELYTNAEVEGAAQANYPPPPSYDICTFKDFTFYAAGKGLQTLSTSIAALGLLTTGSQLTGGIGGRTVVGNSVIGSPVFTLTAGVTTGIVPGQIAAGPMFPTGTKVVSVIANTSVTVDHNAVAVTHTLVCIDVIEVNGTTTAITDQSSLGALNNAAGAATLGAVSVYTQQPLQVGVSTPTPVNILFVGHTPYNGAFTVRATNGANYSPALPEITATAQSSTADPRSNRIYFSKLQQPEAVPPLNYIYVGAGTILRMFPTKDAIFIFCTDGIYRVSGVNGQWRVDPFDVSTVLANTYAIDAMGDVIYCLTNKGFTAVGDGVGVQDLDQGMIGAELRAVMATKCTSAYQAGIGLACDTQHNEVWFTFGIFALNHMYVFNADTGQFANVGYFPFLGSPEYATAIARTSSGLMLISNGNGINGGGNKSVLRVSYPDDDTTHRMQAAVLFHPVNANDPGVLKQWSQIEYTLNSGSGWVFYPYINQVQTLNTVTVPTPTVGPLTEQRVSTWCGLDDSLAPVLGIGYASQDATTPFQLIGVKAMFRPLSTSQVVR